MLLLLVSRSNKRLLLLISSGGMQLLVEILNLSRVGGSFLTFLILRRVTYLVCLRLAGLRRRIGARL